MSENYLQHVDHFERIVSYKNSNQNETSSQNTNLIKEQNTSVSNNNPEEVDKITKNKE